MGQKKTIRLVGVNTVDHNDDHDSPIQTPDHHQYMITIHETSTKRKSYSTTTLHQQEEDDYLVPKKPKILRLFGVDIPIDHLLPTSISSQQDQLAYIQEKGEEETQNPNQEEEAAAPAPIPHNLNQEEAPVPHNPNQQEAATPAPIPHNPNQEEEEDRTPIPPQGNIAPLLFVKVLTKTDITRGQNRLLITGSQSLMAALTEEERRRVEVQEGDFLRVPTRDTNGVEYTLHLKWWPTSNAVVLKHEWGKLVRANGLQQGDKVEGWGYRVHATHQFRLLLNIIRNPFN